MTPSPGFSLILILLTSANRSAPAKPSAGLIEYVLRTGEPLLCTPELAEEMKLRGEVHFDSAPPLHWLGFPLKINHHILGALVLSYSPNVRFRERDKEISPRLQQLAAAIDRKRNEEALRRSEVRYRSLVQTAVYGLYRSSLEAISSM